MILNVTFTISDGEIRIILRNSFTILRLLERSSEDRLGNIAINPS